jgi:hypothetical protein
LASVPTACKWLDPAPLVTADPAKEFVWLCATPVNEFVCPWPPSVTLGVEFAKVPTACRCELPAPLVTALPVKLFVCPCPPSVTLGVEFANVPAACRCELPDPLVTALPVKLFVCPCPPSVTPCEIVAAVPAKLFVCPWAAPANVGTPAGHATVPEGVSEALVEPSLVEALLATV